ncbi:MAG TPA: DUF4037 domain-containing protein [Ktedonobacteraceae bacterium]|nr:DUF4037 domain-containing protein [Ktedonobacteraceae bacterium]
MTPFIPGIELCRRFYEEAVNPLFERYFPALPYAAALIGHGSDVLGFDTAMSMDHDWGPRLQLFFREQDIPLFPTIDEMLRSHLPHMFVGFPVDTIEFANEPGIMVMHQATTGSVNHRIALMTPRDFFRYHLAYDINQPLEDIDWLTFPSQELLAITAGAVYHDGLGELTALRKRFAWYPHDIWLYLLAAGWQRIGQEEHLMPRAGYVGDELGSAIIASRLVRDIMRLCFLMEKRYAPYPKWFGSAFRQLSCAQHFVPILWRVQQSSTWQEREAAFSEAYAVLASMHNALGITETLSATVSSFHDRPFNVIHGEIIAQAILKQITSPQVKHLVTRHLIGSVDQFSDSTDLLSSSEHRLLLRKLYE